MPSSVPFHLLALYLENGKIISGRPGRDDPKPWARKIKADAILTAKRVNINLNDRENNPWTLTVINLGTAAHAGWIKDKQLQAAALILSGVDDGTDLQAASQAERAAQSVLSPGQFAQARIQLPRPGLLLACRDKASFTNRMVATISIALGTAVVDASGATAARRPLGAATPRLAEAHFLTASFSDDGTFGAERAVKLAELRSNADWARLLEFFEERFAGEGGKEFQAVVAVGDSPKLSVQWQSFGGTAGVATVGQGDEIELALLLSGLNFAADDAAIAA